MQLGLPFDRESAVAFYFVRHRRARRYVLRVDHDGRVRVTIPRWGSRRGAMAFGRQHLEWIARQRARAAGSTFSEEEVAGLRERAAVDLPLRLFQLAAHHGLTPTRVSIRDQRSRWGSCGPGGHISLNWRLVLMPVAVRDYVMVHELMHLRRMDHSRRYWDLVAEACPGYQEARRWLRHHGPTLR